LIVCLLFLGISFIWPADQEDDQPEWLAASRTKSALAYGVDVIKKLVPEDAEEQTKDQLEKSRIAAEQAIEAAKKLEDISTPVPFSYGEDQEKPSSYGDDLRGTMDTLIDGKNEE
jgi:hypothetical protein